MFICYLLYYLCRHPGSPLNSRCSTWSSEPNNVQFSHRRHPQLQYPISSPSRSASTTPNDSDYCSLVFRRHSQPHSLPLDPLPPVNHDSADHPCTSSRCRGNENSKRTDCSDRSASVDKSAERVRCVNNSISRMLETGKHPARRTSLDLNGVQNQHGGSSVFGRCHWTGSESGPAVETVCGGDWNTASRHGDDDGWSAAVGTSWLHNTLTVGFSDALMYETSCTTGLQDEIRADDNCTMKNSTLEHNCHALSRVSWRPSTVNTRSVVKDHRTPGNQLVDRQVALHQQVVSGHLNTGNQWSSHRWSSQHRPQYLHLMPAQRAHK